MASPDAVENVSGQQAVLSSDVLRLDQSDAVQDSGNKSCSPETAMDWSGQSASAKSHPGGPKIVQSKPKGMFTTSEQNEIGL